MAPGLVIAVVLALGTPHVLGALMAAFAFIPIGHPAAAAAMPPASARAAGELQGLARQAGSALIAAGVPVQAATDLWWAAYHLDAAEMGWAIGAGLGGGGIDARLHALFDQPHDVLEVAATSLGFNSTMSALDLCADAALLACGEPLKGDGRFYDVEELRRRQRHRLAVPAALRGWIDRFLACPELAELIDCRHGLTHRTPRREITYRPERRGMPAVRELAEITTLHGVGPAQPHGSIADLVPRLVSFGEDQLQALCTAFLAPRPTP